MPFPPQRRPQTAGHIALIHAVLAGAQTRAAALEQIVDYGREAAQKETEALVNRGTALLARAEEAAAGTNTWQEHLAAGMRQREELTARYAAAKDADAEARRAYLSAHSAAASTAMAMTTGTNTALILSARRLIGALPLAACSIS